MKSSGRVGAPSQQHALSARCLHVYHRQALCPFLAQSWQYTRIPRLLELGRVATLTTGPQLLKTESLGGTAVSRVHVISMLPKHWHPL